MLIPMMVISQDYRTQDSMPPEAETAIFVLPTSLNHEVRHRKYATGDFSTYPTKKNACHTHRLTIANANAALII